MAAHCGIVKVGPQAVETVRPPDGNAWKITALIVGAPGFAVKLGNVRNVTALILEGEYNLSTNIIIDHEAYLIFDNGGSKERVGFYSAEIL